MAALLVTGSIAYDRISVFADRFANHILPDQIHRLNLSFIVRDMTVNHGGTGGNIAYNLGLLGEAPLLLGAVGDDFGPYRANLEKTGVNLKYLRHIAGALTAHATIMTDLADNQIASFYPGANAHAAEADIADVKEEIALAIIAPNDPGAMLGYARTCRDKKIPFIADPGQIIPAFSGDDLKAFIRGAVGLIVNDYEWQLVKGKAGITESDLTKNGQWLIVTYGEKGSKLWADGKTEDIPAVPASRTVDPTGCGDAFRAGLMYGIKNGRSLADAARIGAWIASRTAEHAGTQNHTVDKNGWKSFLV